MKRSLIIIFFLHTTAIDDFYCGQKIYIGT